MPGELEHAVKCRCNHNCTLDDIANTLQSVRKRSNIGKYTPYKSSGFKEKQPLRVEFKENPEEGWKKWKRRKIFVTNVVQQTIMPTAVQRQRIKSMLLRKSQRRNPQQRIPTQTLWKMPSEKDPREEFLVEYQQETPPEIQYIQLEAGIPQDTANKNLCKHTKDAQTFLVVPTKGMA
ncbi:hypothetical protein O181_035964 [Austropuccinia psidii MF-1]|uniref:Uncharacterized protein n=1 Tax=Austropuccinia psidii MF-1 TaxID=1389203 RepID=A0A9Q3D3N6_9BASI|nr:hypothetical protein [Austropuccinia psidii MF-1]